MAVYARLDAAVTGLEQRLGPLGSAALVGSIGLGLACLAVRLGLEPLELGRFYAWLSLDPLHNSAQNPVAFRPLTPWLSYAIGLRGANLMYTNLAFAAALLALCFAWFRRHAPRPGDALLATSVLCFSLVTLATVFSPHYCDALTYLIVFAMWCLRRRRVAFYALFAIGLFNRESLAFLAPWFAFLELRESPRARTLATQVVGYGVGLALLFAFRSWIASLGPVAFDFAYYFEPLSRDPLHFFRQSARYQWAGLYSVFGPAWAIAVAGAVAMWQRGDRSGPLGLVIMLISVWSQLWIATDTSRLFTLLFPAMLVALEELFRSGALRFREWAPWLVLLQVLAPHTQSAGKRFWAMDSLFTWLVWR
jgi:hypothetical protein